MVWRVTRGTFARSAEEPLSLDELLALLGTVVESGERSREDAIACYLSASDGWQRGSADGSAAPSPRRRQG